MKKSSAQLAQEAAQARHEAYLRAHPPKRVTPWFFVTWLVGGLVLLSSFATMAILAWPTVAKLLGW